GGSRACGDTSGCRGARGSLSAARGGGEGGELRAAICIRATEGVSDRCLDRASASATVLCEETEGHRAAAPGVLWLVFRGIQRVRAAVPLPPRPSDVAATEKPRAPSESRQKA